MIYENSINVIDATFNSDDIFALSRSRQRVSARAPVLNEFSSLPSIEPHSVDHEIKWGLARDAAGHTTRIADTSVNNVALCAGCAPFIVAKLEVLDDLQVLTVNEGWANLVIRQISRMNQVTSGKRHSHSSTSR